MNTLFKKALFSKHVLVSDSEPKDQVATVYALKHEFNIDITAGWQFASPDMIKFAADELGVFVPQPFYRGFPQSVRELTPDQRLFDQFVHYTMTYGFGDWEKAGHSLFERALERSDFYEEDEPRKFVILPEGIANGMVEDLCNDMCKSSRPLSEEMMDILVTAIAELDWMPRTISSKQTAVDLLVYTRNIRFTKYLSLPDFIKVIDTINWKSYSNEKLNRLHFNNQDRKFVTEVLDRLIKRTVEFTDVKECIEKRQTWKGILHHIHYAPKNGDAKAIIDSIYNDEIKSSYSYFERAMKSKTFNRAFIASYLKDSKGNGALLRNLNYILASAQDVDAVMKYVEASNPLVIMQMQQMYRNYNEGNRYFKFTRHGRIRTHRELERKTVLSKNVRDKVVASLEVKLQQALKGKVGKVYIAPGMEKIAVPMNLSAGESGFGIMPTGSRISLPEGKKIRAFTYWEKVNDIDLSCFGIDEDGSRTEFSWRTMYGRQSDAVTYSGDETSGYHGGSEYFDVDFDKVHEMYPTMKYMVFCDNVYSGKDFSEVVCRAGWMSRDVLDSGEIYEPKTVKSAYTINAKTTFCYLYAIDIEKREVIWLNVADSSRSHVAGASEFSWLYDYFTTCETMNMRKLFSYAGTVVDTPEEAELVVGDIETDKPQIRSYEFEKAFQYLN